MHNFVLIAAYNIFFLELEERKQTFLLTFM